MSKTFDMCRVTTVSPTVRVGDVSYNVEKHIEHITANQHSDIIVFPELSLTGYTCGDLFGQKLLIDAAKNALFELTSKIRCRATVVVGLPIFVKETGGLYNCAAVINDRKLLGIVPKSYLPNYREFYESRWFVGANGSEPSEISVLSFTKTPFGTDLLFKSDWAEWILGVEICEDVWAPLPPSVHKALAGANVLVNLSASNETVGKADYRRNFVKSQTGALLAGYAYCSAGPTESTSDLVFGGHCIIGENGQLLAESKRFNRKDHVLTADIDYERMNHERAAMPGTFTECARRNQNGSPKYFYRTIEFKSPAWGGRPDLIRPVDPMPFVPQDQGTLAERCEDIFSIQVRGLAKRIESLPNSEVVIGVSGGLDSTLALLVTVKAFDLLGIDRKKIIGVTMPGFGTTPRTLKNAIDLMTVLGITQRTIDIRELALQAFRDMGHKPFGMDISKMIDLETFTAELELLACQGEINDLVFENVQARLRTFYLMSQGFVVGTGDLSELALGWCTYNGDHMSMYNVNCSIPKTLVKFLVKFVAESDEVPEAAGTLGDIVNTLISPELLPSKAGQIVQSTEGKLGPYILHDFFLYHFIRNGFTPSKILNLARIAFKYDSQTLYMTMKTFLNRFFVAQFKRNCVPDGPKVGSVSLSPRGDWRMPSDAVKNLWLNDLENWWTTP